MWNAHKISAAAGERKAHPGSGRQRTHFGFVPETIPLQRYVVNHKKRVVVQAAVAGA
jgi:hypothetical protein